MTKSTTLAVETPTLIVNKKNDKVHNTGRGDTYLQGEKRQSPHVDHTGRGDTSL